MIHGVGVDLVRVARVQASLERFGDRFARRILGGAEFEAFVSGGRRADYLAKRFAAKEAFVKALGTGFRFGITLRQIQVVSDPLGRPQLHCTGAARERMLSEGLGD